MLLLDDEDKIIARWDAGRPPMIPKYIRKVVVRCGQEYKFGYRHIEHGHKADWMEVTPTKGNSDWEGLSSFAIKETLSAPLRYCFAGGNVRSVGLIRLYRNNGQLIRSFYVKAGYKEENSNLVTGYPAKNDNCVSDPM